MGWKALRSVVVACLVATIGVPAMAQIAPEAYWRHEEGPAGSDVSTNGDTVLDSSGNGNHMRTFSQFTAATYTTDVPPIPLRSGLPNTLALKFDLDDDGDGGPDLNDDNFTDLQVIETKQWDELTVELAFKVETTFVFQALTGKDGQPIPANPIQPLVIKVRGDGFPNGIFNQLQAEWLDGDGDEHALVSGAVAYALTLRASGRFEDAVQDEELPSALADWASAHMARFQTMLAEIKARLHQVSTDIPYSQWEWQEDE